MLDTFANLASNQKWWFGIRRSATRKSLNSYFSVFDLAGAARGVVRVVSCFGIALTLEPNFTILNKRKRLLEL